MMKRTFLILSACSLLTACEEKVETRPFYKENDDARKERIAWCMARPDQMTSDGNCINAVAALEEKIQKLKQARIAERQERWDSRSSMIIEKEKCGVYQNTRTYKACRDAARREADNRRKEMNDFNSETDLLIETLR